MGLLTVLAQSMDFTLRELARLNSAVPDDEDNNDSGRDAVEYLRDRIARF
jgi:hypothetical protein